MGGNCPAQFQGKLVYGDLGTLGELVRYWRSAGYYGGRSILVSAVEVNVNSVHVWEVVQDCSSLVIRSIIWNDETEFFEPANFKELYILRKPLQTKENRPLDGDTSLEAIGGIENRQLVMNIASILFGKDNDKNQSLQVCAMQKQEITEATSW